MRFALAIFLAACFTVTFVKAQDDRIDDVDFEQVELKDEPIPYFAIGVGPVFQFSFPDNTDINARAAQLGLGAVNSPLFQAGAEIFLPVGLIKNVRIGFSWVAGSSSTSGQAPVLDTVVERTMKYTLSSRTVHIDYAWVPVKGLAVLPGLGLGWGNQTLATFQSLKQRTWADYADTASLSTPPDSFSELSRSIFYMIPRLNIEYTLTPFVAVRAQAGYTYQLSGGDWTGNRLATVTGVPDSISSTAFHAQLGLFIGLFN